MVSSVSSSPSPSSSPSFQFSRAQFPRDFIFGTATSSYQTEGSAFGGCGSSHWDSFSQSLGTVYGSPAGSHTGRQACAHYHHYESDLDLVQQAGLDAYRFSFSWARLFPDSAREVSASGVDFYDRLLDAILARGLRPFGLLYHWDLPSYLADKGGWANRETALYFGEYASEIAARFGDRLEKIATLNEPWCIAWLSHFLGQHAPGLRDIRAASRAMHHVLVAHGQAVAALRARGPCQVGLVLNFEYACPADETLETQQATSLYDSIYNRWFLQAVFRGSYPEPALSFLEPWLPKFYADDFPLIAAPLDWLGVNYYTRKLIRHTPSATPWCLSEAPPRLPQTAMGWEIYPEGLAYFLSWIARDYSQSLPLYVTENGMAGHETLRSSRVRDPARLHYIDAHLAQVRGVLEQGVPVRGYFIWTLMDNYEWALGYSQRFGLVYVDFETQVRTPKDSYWALARALQSPTGKAG